MQRIICVSVLFSFQEGEAILGTVYVLSQNCCIHFVFFSKHLHLVSTGVCGSTQLETRAEMGGLISLFTWSW